MNIRELAARAGLSKTTISAALRDAPRISESTRRRVHDLARDVGYWPDPAVAGMMSAIARKNVVNFSSPILLLSDWPHVHEWERPDHALSRFYQGVLSRTRELGYKIEELWMRAPGMNPRRVEQIIAARKTEGLIIFSYPKAPAALDIDLSQYSCVVIGRALVSPTFYSADHDHHQGMFLSLEQIKKQGYQRPGLCLTEDANERTMHCWAAAYQFYLSQRPAKDRVPMMLIKDHCDTGAYQKWIRTYKPDVVIVSHGGMMEFLGKAGFEIPRDFGVSVLFQSHGCSNVAGIDICDEAIAGRAVDVLVEQMRNNRRGPPAHPETILMHGIWRDGPSLPMIDLRPGPEISTPHHSAIPRRTAIA